ncbi:MAG: PilZ domain-containing protein [Verrucomicrobia bacterium]|nr:PilZ domain-containing protein [Verrucomicrobiota bacterium]
MTDAAEKPSTDEMDRRRHARAAYEADVRVKLYTVSGYVDLADKVLYCCTADLSESGIRLSSDIEIPVGSVLEMSVVSEDPAKVFTHRGEVRWVFDDIDPGKFLLGIEFIQSSSGHRDEWLEFVSARVKREAEKQASAD